MASVRGYLPRSSTDSIAMSVTFIGIPLAFLHGIFYVTPTLYPLEDQYVSRCLHYTFMIYLLVTVMTDLMFTMTTDPSCQTLTLPQMSQPGWSYCDYCKQYVPPRTHHCLTCEKCFLRRDHHCFFVGRCVGYQNHKYFMLFVLHIFVTSVYSLIMSVNLVMLLNGGFSWRVLIASVLPVMAWMMQIININPIVLIGTSAAFLFLLMTSAMLLLHVSHLYKGQTYWEAQNNIPQPKGWMRNARDVLGSNWWLVWVSPLIPSPLPADGMHYPPKEAVKHPRVNPKHNVPAETRNKTNRKKV